MRHCPNCGSEYQDWVKACLDCASPLEEGPAILQREDPISDDRIDPGQEPIGPSEEAGPDKSAEDVEDYVDEVIEPEDFLTPQPLDEYAEPEEIVPRAELISVLDCFAVETVKKEAAVFLTSSYIIV